MIGRPPSTEQVPLNIVGSSIFGSYPKISLEKTYNMFISDDWMVNYGGYLSILTGLGANGRGIYTSDTLNRLVFVVSNIVYLASVTYSPLQNNPYLVVQTPIGTLDTYTPDVYIAENNAGQIAISDQSHIYIYDPNADITFEKIITDFIPGYITFHNGRFISPATGTNSWRLSEQNNGKSWPSTAAFVGSFQTKPDNTIAVVRVPSQGNMIFVIGENGTEFWFDVGYQLFPYQRNSSSNIDYGCVNASTIAATDKMVVWLAKNEKSGPIILVSEGGLPRKISTDGIDKLLSLLSHPEKSEAFIYRQDGHLFYHINFTSDNFSLYYDFNTDKFFHASDEHMNYFIAKEVAFLNNQYYFVSRNNGNLYAFDTQYTTYDGAEIPRIRVCKSIRKATQDFFVVNDLGFTIEQGNTNPIYHDLPNIGLTPVYPRVDFSFSIDGGESFSQVVPYNMNPLGKRINKMQWWRCGRANDFTPQFRFVGFGRFVCTDGLGNIRS